MPKITRICERVHKPFTLDDFRMIAEKEKMLRRQHSLTCPRCKSKNTAIVGVRDPAWKVGHHQCNDCGHREDWGMFCTPPIDFGDHPLLQELRKMFEEADEACK